MYTKRFCELLRSGGITSVKLPPRSPNLNAHAERFVLSIKAECLDRFVILGERHLRRTIAEYVEHYHQERTHQGLGNRVIEGVPEPNSGRVTRRERLGGILSHYYRDAAWIARSSNETGRHEHGCRVITRLRHRRQRRLNEIKKNMAQYAAHEQIEQITESIQQENEADGEGA